MDSNRFSNSARTITLTYSLVLKLMLKVNSHEKIRAHELVAKMFQHTSELLSMLHFTPRIFMKVMKEKYPIMGT